MIFYISIFPSDYPCNSFINNNRNNICTTIHFVKSIPEMKIVNFVEIIQLLSNQQH